ncbi:hypothetical protein VTK26DRAFT_1169 [Humicola hyalothermophila]
MWRPGEMLCDTEGTHHSDLRASLSRHSACCTPHHDGRIMHDACRSSSTSTADQDFAVLFCKASRRPEARVPLSSLIRRGVTQRQTEEQMPGSVHRLSEAPPTPQARMPRKATVFGTSWKLELVQRCHRLSNNAVAGFGGGCVSLGRYTWGKRFR